MFQLRDTIWAGTEAALETALAAEAVSIEKAKAGSLEGMPDAPSLLQQVGNVGVISIKGPLINVDSPLAAMFGFSTYPDIRRALVAAAKEPSITQVLLDVESGGGAVLGVDETAKLITKINDKVKPVTAFAGGIMASAAYWLGSSAGNIFATNLSMVGSIGVIATHMERSKMLEEAGIKVTVIRAGKFKALASPVEPLTAEARAQIQNQIDAVYEVFVQHVAEARGVSFEKADKQMAQGREFMGAEAKKAGLVDAITTFDAVLAKLQSKKSLTR